MSVSIAIFYGSTTGNTEMAANKIAEELGGLLTHIGDVSQTKPAELTQYDVLLLGVSTWNIGEMQDDWFDFLRQLGDLDLTGKKVGLFAMGDSYGYPDNFLDAMGELWGAIQKRGAELVGVWPAAGYQFDESQAMYDDEHFVGLGLDEDNESDQTEDRIRTWLVQVLQEIGLLNLQDLADAG
ncbi:flavodoxin [Blastopirellula sp. J2-11]|uniref:flavodoxin n=1 Tax=Blastopirellula sp. J2-11 TaxID=2943192 RepID=UPI0021C981C6|nr:flavodoxin [Blastopirellula sp. J2-11]UUO05456.1 flavodoxin [Blastopirellula sp. J2-11]